MLWSVHGCRSGWIWIVWCTKKDDDKTGKVRRCCDLGNGSGDGMGHGSGETEVSWTTA